MDASVATTNEVVVSITAAELALNATSGAKSSSQTSSAETAQEGYGIKSSSSPINTRPSPPSTPGKPPRIPNQASSERPSFSRSAFSKPKSRFVEPHYPLHPNPSDDNNYYNVGMTTSHWRSPARVNDNTPITPKTPLMSAQGGDDEDDDKDDEIYKAFDVQASKKSGMKVKILNLIEWIVFLGLMGFLVSSLTIDRLKDAKLWSLQVWKWCVLVMVVFCGNLVTEWFINLLVFMIERNFLFKKKVLYFVYGLKKSVQIFVWLGFVLLAWGLIFNHGVQRSRKASKILNEITMALAGCLMGAGLWLVKTLLIKLLAVSFHVNRFFDRIQESLFNQYILQTLSGPPDMEMEIAGNTANSGRLSFRHMGKGASGEEEDVIDIEKLNKMNQGKVSAWTMKGLIKVVRSSGLTTISNTLEDGTDEDQGYGKSNNEITSEWEAKMAAYRIFKNVAKPDFKYIEEEDLLRFMKREAVDNVFPLFEGATETGKIKKSALTKWVVNAYLERKSLAHSLNDTKTAVEQLNKMVSVLALVLIVVVWNLMMGFLTTKVLVFISSQLLLVVFMFGNTAKTVFEAIIFVFIMHPYDVGDRCVIDGVQMVVEEMNILTTIFLRYDNEKIIYPNSVLTTKPISNFYRSPEMSDSVEFAVDFSTTMETISALKDRIKTYIETKPQHWKPNHSLQVKEIENMNKMKMALYINHTINFQNMGERSSRRCDLIWELKKILEDLGIKYHLLPQQVHVTYVDSPASMSTARC